MPIYDLRCCGCGAEFERLVMGRGAGVCPRCGGTRLERLPSRFAVRGSRGFSGSLGAACGPCAASSCAGCPLARRGS
jgi:putative FmdB family regulatory protein